MVKTLKIMVVNTLFQHSTAYLVQISYIVDDIHTVHGANCILGIAPEKSPLLLLICSEK